MLPDPEPLAQPPSPGRRAAVLALKLGITTALGYWLWQSVDAAAIYASLLSTSPAGLVAAVLLVLLQHGVMAWRWQRLLRWMGHPLSWPEAFRWMLIGTFFGQALPSSVGGDAVRILWLRQRGAGLTVAAGSVLVERVSGVLMLCVLVTGGALVMDLSTVAPTMRHVLLSIGPVAVLAAMVGLGSLWLAPALGHGARYNRFYAAFNVVREALSNPRRALELAVYGLLGSGCGLAAVWVLGHQLGVPLGGAHHFALGGLALLITVLPISLGGWGLREASMVGLFAVFGAPAEPVLAMSLLLGLLPLVVSLPAGLSWWVAQPRGPVALAERS